MKKVLIIAYYFPPSGGAGVQRTLKFVKYLREFGWEPMVLTAKDADYPAYDETLFKEIPDGVKIYRSPIFEPYKYYRLLTGRDKNASTDMATMSLTSSDKQKFTERLSEFIRAAFFVPDARIGWLRSAVKMGKQIIKKEKIDLIYSTAPPYTCLLIGKKLKQSTKLPWYADFRDSWIGWVSTPQWRPWLSHKIELGMERAVLKTADRINAVSIGIKEHLLSRHPICRDDRWSLIKNGYDAEDVTVEPITSDKVTFIYSGSLYGHRNPEGFFKALESIQEKHPELFEKICIRIVGRIGDSILQRINNSPIKPAFEIINYVPHQKSLAYLLGSDYPILIIDDTPANFGIIPGKLFEYIGSRNPIFTISPKGETAEMILDHNLGVVVSPNDVAGLEKNIIELVNDKLNKNNRFNINPDIYKKFERKNQTQKLALEFDQLIEEFHGKE